MRETATELKAGYELDALVAEKVMGWTSIEAEHRSITSHWFIPSGFGPNRPRREAVPSYSTDIAAAMEIFPKLREKGWVYLTVQSLPEETIATEWDDATMRVQWWAELSRYRSPVEGTSPYVGTPALAICLAALSASTEGTERR